MLFNNNSKIANERIIYKTKPNLFLSCKKAFFAFILLIIFSSIAPKIVEFIGEMQVYLISYVKLSLTKYVIIAIFTIIFIILMYIIFQLLSWYSEEYILTNQRIITKKGIFYSKKSYMPYNTIQDINSSQSIIGRIISVGSISVFSAYDSNQINLKNISNYSKVEEIIFNQMNNIYSTHRQDYINENRSSIRNDIKPKNYNKKSFDYDLENNINQAMNNFSKDYSNNKESTSFKISHPNYGFEEIKDEDEEYNFENDHFKEDFQSEDEYFEDVEYYDYKEKTPNFQDKESQKSVLERHFDKFKK